MSKKKIIAIVTVIVLLLAAGISVGVFLHNRGESEAADGSQVVDGNLPTDGTQTGENDENPTTNPDAGNENDGEAGDNETVDNDNENAGNETANNNNAGNAGITTDTNVNDVGETTITRVEEQDRLVSEHFLDWWKPMLVKVNQKTALCVNEPELTVEKLAITGVGGDEFVYTGQNITYVIEVTNNSNKTINNIEIKDKIPQGTSFVSIEDVTIEDKSVAEGTTIGEANSEIGVKWVVTIPSGKTAKAKFTVKVTATEGTISNVAIANGKESTDPTKDPTDPDNETKTSIIKANKSSVITRDGKEVEIAKIGDLITYTITVENTGDAKGTTYITDKVPTGTEFVSTPENEGAIVSEAKDSIAWSITLGANETVTKTFVVKVKEVINGTIVNIANVGGTETEPDNVKVEAYIVFVENGGTEVDDITGVAGEKIENTAMPKTTRHGYVFEGWYAEEELTTKVDKLPETYPAGTTTYYAKWSPVTGLKGIVNYYLKDTTTKLADCKPLTGLTFDTEITETAINIDGYNKVDPTSVTIKVGLEGNEINFYYTFGKSQYTVEYYYEINGNYPSKTELNDVREGTTLSTVAVTADDKTPTLDGYIFDAEYTGNVLDGTVTPDGSLVLKVYFKQQLKVVYTKGSQGTFENQEYTVKYGDIPTTFNGTPTGNAGFHFVGWDKDVTKQVTENVTFIAIWEGLQVRKTRLEIIDKDNLGNTDYVDQDGDIIRYEITVKNIGDIKAENIVLKDSLAIKVVSVEIAGTEVEIANRGSNEFAANADLLQGLTAGIEPNETIVVTVEHTVTDSEVKAALANDSKIINIATAELNDNPYTGTDKTVDPEDGTEEEGTEVKQRCEYRVEYHYNGQLGTADDDVIESAAIVGATISFEKPVERKGFTYMNYVGSTTVTEGTNLIIVNYGKPVVAISKAASATVDAGANIEYTLTVTNTGLVGTTVTVSDELVGTTYVPGSANIGEPTIINNVLTWQVTVGAQSTKTITFKAATPKTAFGQTITNTAHIKNGETIIGSSNEVSTTVNEITVKYTEWKEGQQGTDLNIIFLLDNSASMNEPIAGEENEYSNDNSYYVAPTDVTKTRLYNAKEAIKGFITNQSSNPNTSMSVITFNSDYADTIDRYVLVKNEDIKTKTENGKTIRYTTINGIDYEVSDADDTITATDGNDYCYVTITINEGPVLVGTNSTSNADLTAAVNNITIGSRREGLGTSIAPAIDKITENSSTYLNSAKKNIVIVLADGDFDNPQNDSWLYGRGYVSAKNDLLAKDSNLEIYSVGFGNYVESTMRKVSTNDTCYPATNSSTILNKFNEILDEATGSEQTGTTSDGRITFNEATQTIKVSETCPIVATYETGAVDGEGNPIVETLFTCTSTADLATYGLTITGEKTISWDVKTFIANNPTAIVPNTVSIKYYIPITTSTN